MTPHDDYLWDPGATPDPDIVALERALARFRHDDPRAGAERLATHARVAAPPRRRANAPARERAVTGARRLARFGIAAAVLVAVALGVARWVQPAAWEISTRTGGVSVAGVPLARGARLGEGQTITTEPASSARVRVGTVGDVWIAPASRVSLVDAGADGHQLFLERGEIFARVWSPPRFFVVGTPAATAVDLGCIYVLRVDDDGVGSLYVSHGAVELVASDTARPRTVVVPAGYGAELAPAGPGVPWPLYSTTAFRSAVRELDAGSSDPAALAAVLSASTDVAYAPTLWYLLRSSVDVAPLDTVAGALAAGLARLVPLPAGITVDAVLAGDPASVAAWGALVRATWEGKPESALRRFLIRTGLVNPKNRLKGPRLR